MLQGKKKIILLGKIRISKTPLSEPVYFKNYLKYLIILKILHEENAQNVFSYFRGFIQIHVYSNLKGKKLI